ncbi:rhomboid family intramembrane serine protease [Rufibacter glacialis]|uniref:Rhomboid family intramembrane serine protease n=1 Tax=Rufibacter glacialis TaxID=1259555 RepID=A0A5M8QMB0_9BACT|nr:rhomboid family intramembrane serine protease [Rufibacter glacialis]KAA6435753.1 rhomboid family intramembrane serine protease [Rufibacter glacialis]GGK66198.1 rhomboid family intramembrane serine protease [Rufibacter glacialis]
MTSIFDDIRSAFTKGNNALHQLIFINVVVFAVLIVLRTIMTLSGSGSTFGYLMTFLSLPSNLQLFAFRFWTLITYFFTHLEFFHILFNMLNLYWFGMLIREYLGDKRLVNLYILGGLAGGLIYLLSYNTIPYLQLRAEGSFMMGASGSVIAIMVAAATLLPNYTFNLILIGPIRIKYIALVMVLLSISGATGGNAGGNIAHLGGALLGFFYVRQLQGGSDMGRPLQAVLGFFRGLFQRRSPLKVAYKNPNRPYSASASSPVSSASNIPGNPSQLEIDQILDKISVSGYESLTKEEKQKLFKASQK